MKIIAISQRLELSKHKELRGQLDIKLNSFVLKCGFIPIPIPYFSFKNKASINQLKKWMSTIKPFGVILSGGSDIGKNKIRDDSERFILDFSTKRKIPIAGICRGMQLIGKYFDAKLIKVKNHVNKKHAVISKFKKIDVNSFHNYSLKNCPKNFKVVFNSQDGHIEAIYSKNKKIFACMWHPERNSNFEKQDINIFKYFFNKNKI
jgi:N5-(cytidine 5'-diphosphoramidyl)-L-glutamine hydrolase